MSDLNGKLHGSRPSTNLDALFRRYRLGDFDRERRVKGSGARLCWIGNGDHQTRARAMHDHGTNGIYRDSSNGSWLPKIYGGNSKSAVSDSLRVDIILDDPNCRIVRILLRGGRIHSG